MTNGVSSPISKAVSADLASMTEPGRVVCMALLDAWKWLTRQGQGILIRGVSRRLRVAETVSLGEKRFVSILKVDGDQFLVGGTSSNIILLAKLDAKPVTAEGGSFERVFSRAASDVGEGEAVTHASAEVGDD